ncbi:tRNA (guanosine(18)-2'-O)-methyltransferase TrmH [Chlorobium phaeovibrioides]|uniref:tRNA (guanosine(18)-2'-O)-methyltransferase n=1 Tax=Chlorobium phaeovibrioides TaxID=1094 RepID=A0A5M8ICE2_CHLPH|nr:tRNA (guanosine(18)-2'-O)-methyltransferase TrmH [Chlorobium phaeovibrioides]KAA6232697.1 tRNA (guanosine(18)-2'-O)-methyltransferase TrmH [Chlorobium phaeovibrioides]
MIAPERFLRIQKMLASRQPDLTVVMDNVNKPHNLSAIIRSCDAVGIHDLYAVSSKKSIHTTQNAAAGAGHWTNLHLCKDIGALCRKLGMEGMQVLAATNTEESRDFRTIDFTLPTAIVLGAEWEGVSAEAIHAADMAITIPMYGMVESLNVSVAAALILFEAERQRSLKGMYRTRRLEESLYRKLLFELSYPRLSRQLREKGGAYPELDEDGGIVLEEMEQENRPSPSASSI